MMDLEISREELLKEAKGYLLQQDTGFLATEGTAGLRVSPVTIFMNDENAIYMHCYGGEKMANLRENPEVCLLVIEEKVSLEPGLYDGVQVFGNVREIGSDTELYHAGEKWCPYTHDSDITMLELTPQKMVVVDHLDNRKRKRSLEFGS